jgi:hypothetical protein
MGFNSGISRCRGSVLNGDLDEIIYMECPDGIVREADEVVGLNKSMYGLVQAA